MTTNETQQQPDALTRLERHAADASRKRPADGFGGASRAFEEQWYRDAISLISEARKEMEALASRNANLDVENTSLAQRLATSQETCNRLSAKASEALRMGQQQGRVELAQEVLTVTPDHREDFLCRIISEDASQ